ncbi:hypothetical protein FRD01_22405 [Microvenator marinus]|uniref:WD40 repeat domain-containing protein n=1 Tax=Microvenator marinus TaxID=2600177 RepID=A0A5B8XXM1_9DELT|nr:hypothetical protein [Microvenator marinus]QED29937.1 hypothetical protein FRD01_22405 [Microvenator marinus]
MRNRLVNLTFLLGALGLSCRGETPHPVALYVLPADESIVFFQKEDREPHRYQRVTSQKTETLDWQLNVGSQPKFYRLNDGRNLMCGHLMGGTGHSCWYLGQGTPREIPESEFKKWLGSDYLGLGPNGEWWSSDEDSLGFSLSHNEPLGVIRNLPVEGSFGHVDYNPVLDRFALMTYDSRLQISIVTREQTLVDRFALGPRSDRMGLDTIYEGGHDLLWSPNGKTLAVRYDGEIWVWQDGMKRRLTEHVFEPPLLPWQTADASTSRPELIDILAFSPDSQHLLVRSTRYSGRKYVNFFVGHKPDYEAFAIHVESGEWRRLPVSGSSAIWFKGQL